MRARNIKPGFYTNDQLAECSLPARFIFPGLWMIADREGRLEDRPKRIKAELLPFDDADMDALLEELADAGLIERYAVEGVRYIWIPTFRRHQNPHLREAASEIPPSENDHDAIQAAPKDGQGSAEDVSEHNLGMDEAQPRQCLGTTKAQPRHNLGSAEARPRHGRARLNPESLNPEYLNPPSVLKKTLSPSSAPVGTPPQPPSGGSERALSDDDADASSRPKTGKSAKADAHDMRLDDFKAFWEACPRKVGKSDALKAWGRLAKAGELPELSVLTAALGWQKMSAQWQDSRYIPHPASWLNGRRWEDEQTPERVPDPGDARASPPQWQSKADIIHERNKLAAARVLARFHGEDPDNAQPLEAEI